MTWEGVGSPFPSPFQIEFFCCLGFFSGWRTILGPPPLRGLFQDPFFEKSFDSGVHPTGGPHVRGVLVWSPFDFFYCARFFASPLRTLTLNATSVVLKPPWVGSSLSPFFTTFSVAGLPPTPQNFLLFFFFFFSLFPSSLCFPSCHSKECFLLIFFPSIPFYFFHQLCRISLVSFPALERLRCDVDVVLHTLHQ